MGTAISCTEYETLHPHGFLVLLQAQFTKRPMVHLHCAYIIPLYEWVMSPQYTSVTLLLSRLSHCWYTLWCKAVSVDKVDAARERRMLQAHILWYRESSLHGDHSQPCLCQ